MKISTIVAICRPSKLETGMISRARRLELFDFYVLEKRSPICNNCQPTLADGKLTTLPANADNVLRLIASL